MDPDFYLESLEDDQQQPATDSSSEPAEELMTEAFMAEDPESTPDLELASDEESSDTSTPAEVEKPVTPKKKPAPKPEPVYFYETEDPTPRSAIPNPLSGFSKKHRKRLHNHQMMLSLLFVVLLFLFGIINLLTPTKEISYQENRMLQQRPSFTLASLWDGSYFKASTDFFSDQFFARDGWISLHLFGDRLMGCKEENGVLFCKDGYLIQDPAPSNYDVIANKTEAVITFAKNHPELRQTVAVIPSAASILTDKLPKGAPVYDQEKDMLSMRLNMREGTYVPDISKVLLEHTDEQLYYKTDHHWTSLGAYETFLSLKEELGLDRAPVEYQVYTVSDSFEGTLASESGSHKTKDTIEIYVPLNSEFYVYYPDTQTKTSSPYVSKCLDDKDQYTVFFGGNHALVEIYTTVHNHRNLLVLKDSYANCFVPMLTPYFQ